MPDVEGGPPESLNDETADLWLGGSLRLYQPPRGAHRAGTDAVLLAGLFAPPPEAVICDIGAGTGAVGLAAARRTPGTRLILVERDPDLVDRARRNAALNDLSGRTTIVQADVLAPGAARRAAGLVPDLADIVLTNPPFFERGTYRASPVRGKADAHGFAVGDLASWLRTCVDILRPKGRLGLIHRADALPACLDALRSRFGAIAVRPVHARADEPAIRILLTARKGSRAPFVLRPALILHDASGRFTPDAEALHAGRGWIDPSP
ncbi:tRNA1(Val) (adenine(37)-N6)-methyltransferase [Methylobacterium goesingense]|uniref:tRNA1(Val) A37 N6-methylase TrmN6 n=1 Tax=Methylobacterium goesingense TaxID=243690 RepID=A0ABV2L0N1_9HYPH|nr:methyltransferase [Methylobacterium goesingense]GJD76467.1 tRNA1(Val) (adenine(37)-N6)-methyltransferase [Methylobacterium goesingense]